MKRNHSGALRILPVYAVILLAPVYAIAIPSEDPFSQRESVSQLADLNDLSHAGVAPTKVGTVIGNRNLIWGENVGWVNIRAVHADTKIGSNILAGWIWLENCGWVWLGDGRSLSGRRHFNGSSHNWGVNNDGQGRLSGFGWSEVTGWISFHTGHSQVYLNEAGQFCGYAWGENVGWIHFGPGATMKYVARADPGPWKEMGAESGCTLAGCPDGSAISSSSVPAAGMGNNRGRYSEDAWKACFFRIGRNDFITALWLFRVPVHRDDLAEFSSIRAPPCWSQSTNPLSPLWHATFPLLRGACCEQS